MRGFVASEDNVLALMEKIGKLAQVPVVVSALAFEMSSIAILSPFGKLWSCAHDHVLFYFSSFCCIGLQPMIIAFSILVVDGLDNERI